MGRNPVLAPDVHLPDPEARPTADGRLAVFGSWDAHDGEWCSDRYRVASTPDLVHWQVHGVSFDRTQVPWAQTSDDPWSLFAPDAIERDGRWFLYFCGSDDSEGVTVAERPEGPFTFARRLLCEGIDPAVFIDDDGLAYYLWGQFNLSGAQLAEDMVSLVPGTEVTDVLTEAAHGFHEGSSLRKRGDTYYLVYTSIARGGATTLSYATASAPLGPYIEQGVIVDNAGCDPSTWNNHGSIQEFAGAWYVFYHRSSRASMWWRRLCIEPIAFDDDGLIAEVPMTSQGAGPPFTPGEHIDGWRACQVTGGAWIGPAPDGGEVLHLPQNAATATFRWLQIDHPVRGWQVAGSGTGVLHARIAETGAPIGTARVVDGLTVDQQLVLPQGRHELTIELRDSAGLLVDGLTIGQPPPGR